MSKLISRLAQFGIAKETVRGTPEAAATYYIPWNDLSVEEKDVKVQEDQAYGVIEDAVGAQIVKQWAEASLKAPIGDKHFPLILLAALGTLNTTDDPDTDPTIKDHTVTLAQTAQHQALSLFLDDPIAGQDYKHGLGVVNSLEINYELGKILSYSLGLKAKKGAIATLTPSTTTENRFLPKHLTFKLATNLAGLPGAAAMNIRSLTLKIEKNIEDDDALGSIAPIDFLNKQFSIEGTIEAIFQNETDFKTIALAGTPKAMRIDLKNTDVTIGTAANPQVQIDLAKVIFKEITKPYKVNEIVKQTLSFKAYYSTADTKMITALCVNAVASY